MCYAINSSPEREAYNVVIICILQICFKSTFLLINHRSIFFYVCTDFSSGFDVVCEPLSMSLNISTYIEFYLVWIGCTNLVW